MPGPLYFAPTNNRRGSSVGVSKSSPRGPIELLVLYEFSRQKKTQQQDRPVPYSALEPRVSGRGRLDSIDSVMSTSSTSSTNTILSNAPAISPVTVLAEIHYDATQDSQSRSSSDSTTLWQCQKHKTRLSSNSRAESSSSTQNQCSSKCACYDWIEGRGREVADGLQD